MDCACALKRRRVAGSRIDIKTNKQTVIYFCILPFVYSLLFLYIDYRKKEVKVPDLQEAVRQEEEERRPRPRGGGGAYRQPIER